MEQSTKLFLEIVDSYGITDRAFLELIGHKPDALITELFTEKRKKLPPEIVFGLIGNIPREEWWPVFNAYSEEQGGPAGDDLRVITSHQNDPAINEQHAALRELGLRIRDLYGWLKGLDHREA